MKVYLKPWWANYLPWHWKKRKIMQALVDYTNEKYYPKIMAKISQCFIEGRDINDKDVENIIGK